MNTIDTMSVNAIRVLSADAIQKAKSGHPGLPLGSAPAAYELWMNHGRSAVGKPRPLYFIRRSWLHAVIFPAPFIWIR